MFANTKVVVLSLALALTSVAAVPQQLSSILSVPTETLPSGASSAVPSASGSLPLSVPSISGSLPLSGSAPITSSASLITTGTASGALSSASGVPTTSAAGTSVPATTVAVTTASRPVSGSGSSSGTGTTAAASGSSTGTNNNGAMRMGRGTSGFVAALGVLARAGLAL